jgi:hypothetical protein
MDENAVNHPCLFLIRVWSEPLGNGKAEWRGKLQCITSGETRYFRDLQRMVVDLQAMLGEAGSPAESWDTRPSKDQDREGTLTQ